MACGAAIGLERSYKNRPAGFRTHILVCVGSTVAALTGLYIYLVMQMPADISRMGAQVIAGLGFIGAGTIIVTQKKTVNGLTTAAGLWATGLVGLSIGNGFYEGGILATICILLTETYISVLGHLIRPLATYEIYIKYDYTPALDQAMRYCKNKGHSIVNLQVTTDRVEDITVYSAHMTLRPRHQVNHDEIYAHIRNLTGVISVE